MNKVVIDLAGCSGTEQPYVMASRSASLDSLIILRDFNFAQITKRRSEDLRNEFSHLDRLKLKIKRRYRLKDEVAEGGDDSRGAVVTQDSGDNLKKRKRVAAKFGAPQKRAKARAGGTEKV